MMNIEWLIRVAKEAAEMAGPNDTEFRLVVNGEKLDATYEVVEGQKSFAEVLHSLANVDVEAPPPLKSDCTETEKLMGGCPLTPCSESSSSSGETDALPLPWSDWTGEGLRLHVFDGRGIAVGVVAEINGRMEIIGDRNALRDSILKVIPRLDEKNIVNDSMSNITKINGPEIRMCLNGLTILGESIVADDAVRQNTGDILPNFSFAHVKRL